MKILIGSGTPEQLGRGVVQAFENAGWETHHLDTSPESPYYKPFIKPVRKIINALRIQRAPDTFESWSISNINWRSNRWRAAVEKIRPDVALHLWGHRLNEECMRRAAQTAPHICWMIEARDRLSTPSGYVKKGLYRHLLVYAQNYAEELAAEGLTAHYLPHFAPFCMLQDSRPPVERTYDWCFLGSHSPWREECLAHMARHFPHGIILGPRWKHALKKNPHLRPLTTDSYLDGPSSYALYLRSRVGLDIPSRREWTKNGVTMRVPELIACGAHVLTSANAEMGRLPYFHRDRFTIFDGPETLPDAMARALEMVRNTGDDMRLAAAREASGYAMLVETVGRLMRPENFPPQT
ncbi:MAG: hypothetical protein SFY92_10795 [Verrucomicrobiae bacterium]|nr:hypothetical protein [Verrucomicrobiae bacterium]